VTDAVKRRLLALARKSLDESSPAPERATSLAMLARETIRLLGSAKDNATAVLEKDPEAERVEATVAAAVHNATRPVDPESEVTWVEYDPPPPPRKGPQFGGEFGKPPRRPR
jgi:hypothetical protein